jgi:hypothetical protein
MSTTKGQDAIHKFCNELLRDGSTSLILFVHFVITGVGKYKLMAEDAVSVEVILERVVTTSRPYLGEHGFEGQMEKFKKDMATLKQV